MTSEHLAQAVIWIVLFLAICGPVHECAHAFVAWKLGDGTAKLFGRITLDPFKHFDPVGGTLLVVTVLLSAVGSSPVGFGWAKPTPVNPYNLRGRHADSMVAAAGPLSNLALAAIFAIAFRVLWATQAIWPDNTSPINMLQLVFFTGIELNVLLMVFNLIPIPPLDGSKIVMGFLPERTRYALARLEPYGFFVIIGLLYLGALDPVIHFFRWMILTLIGLLLP